MNGITNPNNLQHFGDIIRTRTVNLLDSLPIGEEFDWVPTVSIELTTQMLATLFDFPFEDRHKLTRWSDVITAEPESDIVENQEARVAELNEMAAYFVELQKSRLDNPDSIDLLTMIRKSPCCFQLPLQRE